MEEKVENIENAENIEATTAVAETPASENSEQGKKGKFNKDRKKPFDRKRQGGERRPRDEFEKRVVFTNRVSKSVKGGKIISFSSLVVVGDKKGRVGVGLGKSRETTEAIDRATKNAKKNLVSVPIVGTTIPHAIEGKFGTSKVILLPSKEGNGIIAGGSARAVLELAGYRDISAKLHGSTNKANCVKATLTALQNLHTREEIMRARGLDNAEVKDGE